MNAYNGWTGKTREVRGRKFYQLLKAKKLPVLSACEVCGGDGGLTYHAEEYGSTWESYIASCHQVCAYCHGMIHARYGMPNRWKRHLYRIGTGQPLPFKFTSLYQFFGVLNGVSDIEPDAAGPSGINWLDNLSLVRYNHDYMKVALVDEQGVLKPDPLVYTVIPKLLMGVRYDHVTGNYTEFTYGDTE